jgi:CRP/FNR family transcriptional regulator, cyclic AMP receptor protein
MSEKPILERVTFRGGDKIFREGDPGDTAYVIQSGAVEIFKTVDGNETVLATLGQGGMFGEMALIGEKPRMATARASEGTTVIVISRMMFENKLAKADPFIRALLNILADSVRDAAE